jgi:hypothetical protein
MDKGRQYMEQIPPAAAAAPVVTTPLRIPESVVSPTPPPTMPCLFSPSAPQVEDYALDAVPIPSNLEQATLMPEKQAGPAPRDVRPRTRSIARVECLVIPSSFDISDSEEEHDGQDRTSYFVPKQFGASKSVAATKKVTGTAQQDPKLFVRSNSAIYQIHFCADCVELEEAKDYQHPPSQINSALRIGSANEDSDASYVDGPPELISSSADDGDM